MTIDNRPRKTLFRGKSTNLCGWCYFHKAGMTVRQMKLKKCLVKQCNAFQKFPEHPYWKQREFIKQQRKKRKAERWGRA